MNPISETEELSQLYSEELHLARDLEKLLHAEEAALRGRDTEFIQNCTEKKTVLLTDFEHTESKRQALYLANKDKIDDAVSKKHQQLKALMENIQQQNLINAGIVKVSQEFTHQLLDIVRGISRDHATYDALGGTVSAPGNQSLAKV